MVMSELRLIVKHSTIVSVWIIEENDGDWYIAIDYISDHGKKTERGELHGHLNKKKTWRKLQTVIEFWKENVPEYKDLNLKLE